MSNTGGASTSSNLLDIVNCSIKDNPEFDSVLKAGNLKHPDLTVTVDELKLDQSPTPVLRTDSELRQIFWSCSLPVVLLNPT